MVTRTESKIPAGLRKSVINGAGWIELASSEEFASLKKIENRSKGPKHVPVQHWDMLQIFNDRLAEGNVNVDASVGMLSPNTEKFVYVADVGLKDHKDFTFQLGFISYNDKSKAMRVIAADRVFCCSNQMFRGLTDEKQYHLKGASDAIVGKIDSGIEKFKLFRDERLAEIKGLKNFEINRDTLGTIVMDLYLNEEFGKNPMLIGSIVNEWVSQHSKDPRHEEFIDNTAWSLQNCATEQFKKISYNNRLRTDAEFSRILMNRIESK